MPQKLSRSFGSQVAPFPSLSLLLSSSLRQFQIISRTEKHQQAFFKTPTTIAQLSHSKAVANSNKTKTPQLPPFLETPTRLADQGSLPTILQCRSMSITIVEGGGGGTSGFSGFSGFSGASGFSGFSGTGASGFSGAGTSGFSGFSGAGGGGLVAAQGAKAWVNFNGQGTVAIRSSYNVASLTDHGTGDYSINFTTPMANADYAVTGVGTHDGGSYVTWLFYPNDTPPTASSCRVNYLNSSLAFHDPSFVCVVIHGD